jgi:hypothetical protein
MPVFPKPKLDQPAVRPSIDKAFVALSPNALCTLAHIKRTISHGVLFELQLEASIAVGFLI